MIIKHLQKLIYLSRDILSRHGWMVISIILTALYVGAYAGFSLYEEMEILNNYTWWFIVTVTTVGYGDYAPGSEGGRFVAGIVMLVGIGIIGLFIGTITEKVVTFSSRRTRGLLKMKRSEHTILFGYREGSTECVIEELRAVDPDSELTLCSEHTDLDPIDDPKVLFIKGDLASNDVLSRSNAKEAKQVIIHGTDDNQSFFCAYAFRSINEHARMICHMDSEEHYEKIMKLPSDDPSLNKVILPLADRLVAQELQEPGSSEVIQQLISNLAGANMYRIEIPTSSNSLTFKDLFFGMKSKYDATPLAIQPIDGEVVVNPGLELKINPGETVLYAAVEKITELSI